MLTSRVSSPIWYSLTCAWGFLFNQSFYGYMMMSRFCCAFTDSDVSETIDEAVPLPQLGAVCWLRFDDQFQGLEWMMNHFQG